MAFSILAEEAVHAYWMCSYTLNRLLNFADRAIFMAPWNR